MKLIRKNEIKVPTLKECGIENASGLFGDLIETLGKGPMTCGFFRMDKPGSFDYTYSNEEFKVILDGEITVKDKKGKEFTAKKGDIFYFENGDKLTFDTKSSGTAVYVSQRKKE